jgi:DNA polymerase
VSDSPAAELGRLCRLTASLVRDITESRWSGMDHIRVESAVAAALKEIAGKVASCRKCPLCEKRKNTVFGEGSPAADLMFVGEGPGADEDRLGRPFVGRAGGLLDDIISKGMGLRREQVYIANVVKCRPPGNRDPEPAEIAMCAPYLHAQIDLIQPSVIVALGKFAAQVLLDTGTPISKLRGNWGEYRGVRLMPTYHPGYLLRNPGDKALAWRDIQEVMSVLGLEPPARTQ